MDFSDWIFLILGLIFIGILILRFRFLVKKKKRNAPITVQVFNIKKGFDKKEAFLYVDLLIQNIKAEPVRIIEIQQRHILGPWKFFELEDRNGKRKISFFECREYFTKQQIVVPNGELIRNYRMKIIPELATRKLFLQFLVLIEGRKGYTSKGVYVNPSELEG